jgi:hypothetical protein
MSRALWVIVAGASLALTGCAKLEPVKPGMSLDQVNADKEACWDFVLNTPEGRRKVKILHALRVVTGGPVMLLMIDRENPREDSVNEIVFNNCMKDRGYTFSRKRD